MSAKYGVLLHQSPPDKYPNSEYICYKTMLPVMDRITEHEGIKSHWGMEKFH